MHKPDQPQTTHTATSRDAAAQISADDEFNKARAIWKGALAKEDGSENRAGFWLALQLADLTSSSKFDREFAKEKVRELVKLGKGE